MPYKGITRPPRFSWIFVFFEQKGMRHKVRAQECTLVDISFHFIRIPLTQTLVFGY
jgi:hypothetical protein